MTSKHFLIPLLDIIKDLERSSSNREIIFDLNKIEAKFKDKKVISDSRSQIEILIIIHHSHLLII